MHDCVHPGDLSLRLSGYKDDLCSLRDSSFATVVNTGCFAGTPSLAD
jgi:hypothetical protein